MITNFEENIICSNLPFVTTNWFYIGLRFILPFHMPDSTRCLFLANIQLVFISSYEPLESLHELCVHYMFHTVGTVLLLITCNNINNYKICNAPFVH